MKTISPRPILALIAAAAGLLLLGSTCKLANKAPAVPTLTGPTTGVRDSTYSFVVTAADPEGDSVAYRVAWGDDDTSDWLALVATGQSETLTHSWDSSGTYEVTAQARDSKSKFSDWSLHATIAIDTPPRVNQPPLTPESIYLVPIQLTGAVYQSRAFPVDPDGDAVSCRWDWGTGDTSEWGGLGHAPGYFWSPQHAYATPGTYSVRAQVRDTWGLTSEWSQPRTVVANEPDFAWRRGRTVNMPIGARSIVMHPSGDRYFVAGTGGVAAMSATGDTALGVAHIPRAGANGGCPLAMSSDGEFLYIVSYDYGWLWRVRTSNMTVVDSVSVGQSASDVAVSPDGQHVYAIVPLFGQLVAVQTSDMTVVHTTSLGYGITKLAVNPSGEYVYVGRVETPALFVIRTSDYAIEKTLPVAPYYICVLPDGNHVYVGDYRSSTVVVVQTSDHTVSASVPVSDRVGYLAATPNGQYVYLKGGFYNSEDCGFLRTSDNTLRGFVDLRWDAVAFSLDGQTAYCVVGSIADIYTR